MNGKIRNKRNKCFIKCIERILHVPCLIPTVTPSGPLEQEIAMNELKSKNEKVY